MKKIKFAMTLAEVMFVMFIIGIVTTCLIVVFKPKFTRNNVYHIRATLNNIEQVNDYLLSENRENGKWSFDEGEDGVINYCKRFADTVSTKGEVCCSSSCSDYNFVLPTNVSISGLNGDWDEAFNGSENNPKNFKYKDIIFDTNANKEPNQEGVDRFGVRILKNEHYAIPIRPQDGDNNILVNNSLIRYKVIVKRKNGGNDLWYDVYEPIETVTVNGNLTNIKNGISYGSAACITGLADEFLTLSERNSIPYCKELREGAEGICQRYFDCDIQIMDIPTYASMFTVRKSY
ncbi:MAG: hypothetical protein E7Z91_07180 [Cyanobacteria bacterium SIG30]|nr:hypothetical protein [Cyanobacteria bacterium SIG30]